jgi:hypothetical protein
MSNKALLVGINAHPLKGCINDVLDMAGYLTSSCGFRPEEIRFLRDDEATAAGIKAALRELVATIRPGDRVLFHYSGHGAQMPTRTGSEIDGLDEVICPVDFDWTDEHAVKDDDFREAFKSVPSGVHFVWVSDSCHSGDLTRRVNRLDRVPRRMQAPPVIAADIKKAKERGFQARPLIAEPESLNLAFIAGCRSDQSSADANFNGRWNGAATFFLLQELRTRPGEPLNQVVPNVTDALLAANYEQEPQLEGSRQIAQEPFLQG